MAYDDLLADDQNRVRFLINDTSATPALSDSEIDWIISEEPNVYFSAARALGVLVTKWASSGDGIVSKKVEDLMLTFGIQEEAADAVEARIKELRIKGSRNFKPRSRGLKMIRTASSRSLYPAIRGS